MDWREIDKIYNSKTREYFKEVLNDYVNGNFRSAVVMLYSVVISDLLFKLQELVEMYDDKKAKIILNQIEDKRKQEADKVEWEKEIVRTIVKETELVSLGTQCELDNLRSWRNLSAHPALNSDYELLAPTQEITVALMRTMLDDILSKPPIFIGKIVDVLLHDLEEKKTYYIGNRELLRDYLLRKYYNRMTQTMKKQVLRSLWKLCFCLPEDERCNDNRVINRKALEVLSEVVEGIEDFMKSDTIFSTISTNEMCVIQLCIFLSWKPSIYLALDKDVRVLVRDLEKKDDTAKLISWFTSTNKTEHMMKVIDGITNGVPFSSVSEETIRFVASRYSEEGLSEVFLDFCIEYYGSSRSFAEADFRFGSAISPFLRKMSRSQFVRLISLSNINDQLYRRNLSYSANTEIITQGREILGTGFNFDDYSNFKFSYDVLKNEHALPEELGGITFSLID